MAVHVRLIRNNIKSSSSCGKYFAKAVSQGEVTLDESVVFFYVIQHNGAIFLYYYCIIS